MHNRKIVRFQGQIETALKNFRADLELRLKELFAVLHIQSHLTAAGIRKCEGFRPVHLLFVLTSLVFLHIKTVHDLLQRPLTSLFQAQKDAFYRFKKAEWSWGPFYRRFLACLGKRLHWSETAQANCFILDTSALSKRGKRLENLSFVYDHSQGKTVKGYEILALGLLTPRNFYPVNFGHHFSHTAPAQAPEARPVKTRGEVARRLQEARELTKPALALKMLKAALAQGIPALYLLVDAWFTSPTFCQEVKNLGLHVIGRLKRDRTRYYRGEAGYTLDQLYQAHKHRLVKAPALGLSLLRVPVSCGHGLKGAIVFTKGYKEPDLATRPGGKIKAEPPWAAFFTTDLSLTAVQVVQKYLGRWSIEVFFKEAKQRLGLGQEQGRSFAAQVYSVIQAFFRYSLLAYLLEHDEQSQTIGDLFRQLEEETGKLTYLERLWQYLATFLKTVLNTLAQFCDPGPQFRAYLDAITNTFNRFSPLQGCET
ncbi:MAG: IS4 family transposase [Candidatus Hadarchaeum sp.]|uniref:IS4 family transposase n=1 Tax=Candidatus Hadarchaeum sp. TaxID=2883567 RepID=UPI003D0DE0E5